MTARLWAFSTPALAAAVVFAALPVIAQPISVIICLEAVRVLLAPAGTVSFRNERSRRHEGFGRWLDDAGAGNGRVVRTPAWVEALRQLRLAATTR